MDVVFFVVYGVFGEDGVFVVLCVFVGVCVVGFVLWVGVIGMDKWVIKFVVVVVGFGIVWGCFIVVDDIGDVEFEGDVVVKLVLVGLSYGVSLVIEEDWLLEVLCEVVCFDWRIFVEEVVWGCEIDVVVLCEKGGI